MYALAASTLLFATSVLAADHMVAVGPGLVFSPDSISDVAEGDMVHVTFGAGHDIAQSTFAAPCQYMEGGIYSGPSPKDGDVFSFEVANASAPMWFFCAVTGHCQGGMALVINPTAERTIDAYKSAAAQAQTSGPSSDSVVGGTIGDEASASSSASGSASSSSTASSTASGASSSSSAGSGAGNVRVAGGLLAGLVAAGAAFAL